MAWRQAIIWINAEPIPWRIYAALRGYELTHCDRVTHAALNLSGWRQAIIWRKAETLLIQTWEYILVTS